MSRSKGVSNEYRRTESVDRRDSGGVRWHLFSLTQVALPVVGKYSLRLAGDAAAS